MSQTETLLLVVLGFSLATLIALFIGRFLWAAALKIGARRMQKQVPSNLVGLQTERDRLRAEYAMLSQRLGARLEATRLKMAEQMAEVSRHRNRLEALEADRTASAGVIESLTAEAASLKAQLEDAWAVQAELQQTVNERQQALDEALRLADHQRRQPAAMHMNDSVLADSDPERRLRERIDRLNMMANHVAQERRMPEFQDHGATALQASPAELEPRLARKLEEAERQTAGLQKELEQLDAEWSKQLDDLKPASAEEARSEPSEPPETPGEPRAAANVISLAGRIRQLKNDLSSN